LHSTAVHLHAPAFHCSASACTCITLMAYKCRHLYVFCLIMLCYFEFIFAACSTISGYVYAH
ncbi:hypothetical protein F5879DRAFT_964876, partial [Lentinula edodes]